MKRGDQVAYIPQHVWDTRKSLDVLLEHPHVEYGFVTSVHGDNAYCRFWLNDEPDRLRTISCSEQTPIRLLVYAESKPQEMIDELALDLYLQAAREKLDTIDRLRRGVRRKSA